MREKILDRLRKLIRHQQSAKAIGSQHEAEAFAERIQILLDEHNLSMSEIEIEEQKSTIGTEKSDFSVKRAWRRMLINAICHVNGVLMIYLDPHCRLVGSADDRAIVLEFYSYFTELGEHLSRPWQATGKKATESFRAGYAYSLQSRIRAAHEDALAKAAQNANGESTVLVYIGNKIQLARDHATTALGMKLKDRRYAVVNSHDGAYRAGLDAGSNVALTNKIFGR